MEDKKPRFKTINIDPDKHHKLKVKVAQNKHGSIKEVVEILTDMYVKGLIVI